MQDKMANNDFYRYLLTQVAATKAAYDQAQNALATYEASFGRIENTRPQNTPRFPEVSEPTRSEETASTQTRTAAKAQGKKAERAAANRAAAKPAKVTKKSQAKTKAEAKPKAETKAPQAEAKTKTGGEPKNGKAVHGNRKNAAEDRPSNLAASIAAVMGSHEMTADKVYAALQAKGWLPNSKDPHGYIRYTLSSRKDLFARVEGKRGHYVRAVESKDGQTGGSKGKGGTKGKATSQSTETVQGAESTQTIATPEPPKPQESPMDDVESLLKDVGLNLSEGGNPFESKATT
jgi:hypothetical protein